MQSYPLGPGSALESTGMLRMDKATLDKLRDAKNYLLDRDRSADYDSWLGNFPERFQDELQHNADKGVRSWMKLVAI